MSKGLNMMNELASKMAAPKPHSTKTSIDNMANDHNMGEGEKFGLNDLKSHLCPDCHSAIALSMGSKHTKGRKMSTESGNENG